MEKKKTTTQKMTVSNSLKVIFSDHIVKSSPGDMYILQILS